MTTITLERSFQIRVLEQLDVAQSLLERSRHHAKLLAVHEELRAALSAPATAPAAALPKGWRVDTKDDLFKTISVVAPNGYSAITTIMARNPENVLRMLVQDLLSTPATAPDELEQLRKDAERYRWLRKTTNWVSSKGLRINVRDFPKSWDEHIDDAMKDKP